MFSDDGLVGASAVLGGVGGGEVPFYIAGSADEGDVVEVDYLGGTVTFGQPRMRKQILTLRMSSNFGCTGCQYICSVSSGALRMMSRTLRALDTEKRIISHCTSLLIF